MWKKGGGKRTKKRSTPTIVQCWQVKNQSNFIRVVARKKGGKKSLDVIPYRGGRASVTLDSEEKRGSTGFEGKKRKHQDLESGEKREGRRGVKMAGLCTILGQEEREKREGGLGVRYLWRERNYCPCSRKGGRKRKWLTASDRCAGAWKERKEKYPHLTEGPHTGNRGERGEKGREK